MNPYFAEIKIIVNANRGKALTTSVGSLCEVFSNAFPVLVLSHVSTFYTTKRPIVRKSFDTPCYRSNNVFPPLPYNARNRLVLYDARGMICVGVYSADVCGGSAPLLRCYSGTASAF